MLGSVVKHQDEIINQVKAIASLPIPKRAVVQSQDPNNDYVKFEFVFRNYN